MPGREQFELSTEDLDLVAELARPGLKDSTILTLDSVLTLMRLARAEAGIALGTLPELIGLNLARAPVYLLGWISFSIFVACVAYVLSGNNLLWGAGVFFGLHLAVALFLELRIRRLHARMEFPESRKGLAILRAGLRERLSREPT